MTARSAGFDLREQDGAPVLALTGDWTVWTIDGVEARLREAAGRAGAALKVALGEVGAMDIAGAYTINRATAGAEFIDADESTRKLIEAARAASAGEEDQRAARPPGIVLLFDRTGRAVHAFWTETLATLSFLGLSLIMLGRVALAPRKLRWVTVVHVMETAGFNAVPIVALLSFFVGVVVAYLGARALSDFGQTILTVELVSASMLQEFSVIITAVLLAGRTDSAFTAEIGAMKMRQEIDALRVLGLDPFETLVVPRLIAMTVLMVMLTFVSMMAGIGGGMLICWLHLDISPTLFITRLEDLPKEYFWMGIAKTPFIGFVLAQVGCRHGLQTGGDVTSLGARVTTSVVQAIFLSIVMDMLFAIWFREMLDA